MPNFSFRTTLLIYNGTSVNPDNSNLFNSYVVGSGPYNMEGYDSKYTGYTYDRDTNETDSFIKKEVDTWYKNTLGSNNIYDSKVVGGRFCSDSSGYQDATDFGFDYVFASFDRLFQVATNYTKPNSPTLKCPATTESYGGSYRLKAGIITVDELVLAGDNLGVETDIYLNSGDAYRDFWTMTPATFDDSPTVWLADMQFLITSEDRLSTIRPVINVTTENGFTSGDGTSENPYVIS